MRYLITATLLLVLGCSGQPDASGPPFETWDSAGVQIVRSNRPIQEDGNGWAVSDRPTLVIATHPVEPAQVIHWIRGVVRLSDGRIATISESSRNLLFFNVVGELTQVVGRDGGGPGEFRSPFQLSRLPGDTLVVTEKSDRRSWFSPTGEFMRVVTPDRDQSIAIIPVEYRVGFGQFVAPSFGLWEANERDRSDRQVIGRRWRTPRSYLLARDDGTEPKILGWFEGWERFNLGEGVARWAFFGRNTWATSGGDPPRIYIGDSQSFDLKVFDLSGRLVQIIRDAVPQTPIEDGDVEWERWEVLDWAEGMGRLEQWIRYADAMPIPDQKPAFEYLIVDSEGHLWVKEYCSYKPDPIQYRIYSPDGIRVGTVKLPGHVRVFDIGPDYVLGVGHDRNYVETIQMFNLRRPRD
ncbi:hypothetical protein ACGF5M_04325 [Gemmatimonadota bacterium]